MRVCMCLFFALALVAADKPPLITAEDVATKSKRVEVGNTVTIVGVLESVEPDRRKDKYRYSVVLHYTPAVKRTEINPAGKGKEITAEATVYFQADQPKLRALFRAKGKTIETFVGVRLTGKITSHKARLVIEEATLDGAQVFIRR